VAYNVSNVFFLDPVILLLYDFSWDDKTLFSLEGCEACKQNIGRTPTETAAGPGGHGDRAGGQVLCHSGRSA
jgi:hypothetical protein